MTSISQWYWTVGPVNTPHNKLHKILDPIKTRLHDFTNDNIIVIAQHSIVI